MTITREALIEAGYKPFTQKGLRQYTDSHYQKCVRDAHGKKYYITIAEYDNRKHKERLPMLDDFSYAPESQFTDSNGITFNVEAISPKSVEDMEIFFERQFTLVGCSYYERYNNETQQ